MAKNTRFVLDDIVYDVEHTKTDSHYLERVVVWTDDEEYVGDVFMNHNEHLARSEFKDGARETSHYAEITKMSIDEIARWIIDRA